MFEVEKYVEIKTSSPYTVAHVFHARIDEQLAKELAKNPDMKSRIGCQKGCHWCCHQSVLITLDEAELIFYYMALKSIEIDLSLDNPKLCQNKDPTVKMFVSPIIEIIASASLSSGPSGNMAKMIEKAADQTEVKNDCN